MKEGAPSAPNVEMPVDPSRPGPLPFEALRQVDEELARLARQSGALRLEMGAMLEALARGGGHHELGFSSLEAYALERCERSGGWARETRAVARRLRELPAVRRALAVGEISWSMARLLAGKARTEDAQRWLELARTSTVRAVSRRLEEGRRAEADASPAGANAEAGHGEVEADVGTAGGAAAGAELDEGVGAESPGVDARSTLTITMDQDEAWLFEATRMLMGRIAGRLSDDELVYGLCAEAWGTMRERGGAGQLVEVEAAADREAEARWLRQRAAWRAQAEALCEKRGFRNGYVKADAGPAAESDRRSAAGPEGAAVTLGAAERAGSVGVASRGAGEAGDERLADDEALEALRPRELDGRLRALSVRLGERDLRMGMLFERLRRADGWRRLGYASEAQYARERVGVSLTSLKERRTLALRALSLPELREAVARGTLGFEAGRLVSRIATRGTEGAWIARARERTVKHLREEVAMAELLARVEAKRKQAPPDDAELAELFALEAHVKSGAAWREAQREAQREAGGVPSGGEGRGAQPYEMTILGRMCAPRQRGAGGRRPQGACGAGSGELRLVGAERGIGRTTYRLRVTRETQWFYRDLERAYLGWRRDRVSFIRFLCGVMWRTWHRALEEGERVAYADVYARDRYTCSSPVCSRRDLTPHHLRFRSRGGDDSMENLTALCVWCHLEGIHGGRLSARPPASAMVWKIGRKGTLVVRGRRRAAA